MEVAEGRKLVMYENGIAWAIEEHGGDVVYDTAVLIDDSDLESLCASMSGALALFQRERLGEPRRSGSMQRLAKRVQSRGIYMRNGHVFQTVLGCATEIGQIDASTPESLLRTVAEVVAKISA